MKNILLILFLLVIIHVKGQETEFLFPPFSPKGNISQIVGNTLIEVEYERPSARKRQIFGSLVPWNKIWRTGAGNCSKIRFNKDVEIGSQKIPAGNYSIFTIPNPKEWIIILNKDTTLYGSYDYDYKKDIARFIVIPEVSNRFYETLNFDMELNQHNAKMYISWTNIQVSFDIKTSTNTEIEKLIKEELLTEKNKLFDNYAGAAAYLSFRGVYLAQALILADKAKELDNDSEWVSRIKIEIYEILKLYDDAFDEVNKALNILKRKKDRANEISEMESKYKQIKKLKEN